MSLHVNPEAYHRAITCIQEGGVLAYPTEGVYGLGCDPFNETAVQKLLSLKQRSVNKGLILIASSWEQLEPLVKHQKISPAAMNKILDTWPGPATWVFPATDAVPAWIKGQYETVAVRISDHPQVIELCHSLAHSLVSTSANLPDQKPAINNLEVFDCFGDHVDYILPGRVGELGKSTTIKDARTGDVLRK